MKPIRIIDNQFNLLAEIDQYESMFLIRRWSEVGELELRINRHMSGANLLTKGNIILVGDALHKVYIIKHREVELDENGKASENWNVKALALKSVLGQRITLPPLTTAYDNKQGDAETVMKHYVDNNVISPSDADRIITNVSSATNQNRGMTVSWRSRFKNLAEELTNISLFSGIGWNVSLDIQQLKWVFDVSEGRELTVNQSTLPPVIFSPQFDSLRSLHYTESELNYKNIAYVAGQGEGIDRRVVELGADTGLNRHEIFIDARDVAEETEDDPPQPRPEQDIIDDLTDRGQQELNGLLQEKYLEGQILTNSPFKYEQDYDLGDIVTIQNKDWNVTMNARITEIKEIYERSGFQIEATFGNKRPTLIDKIKREFSQIGSEVRK
jgi:Siphovirus ReqiPepy6 Gp37-like protein